MIYSPMHVHATQNQGKLSNRSWGVTSPLLALHEVSSVFESSKVTAEPTVSLTFKALSAYTPLK